MTTVVLGLDGGCFDLIEEWIDSGDLPNIAKLRDGGVAGDMQSCLPPVTCPNWRCYSTGRNPGKLGVFWFEKVDRAEKSIVNTITYDEFDGIDFWADLDGESAIVNLPTSYPPPEMDGIHISGGPGAEQTGYTFPPSKEEELEREYNYRVQPEKMGILDKDNVENECITEIRELIDTRFNLVRDLINSGEFEFIHLTIFYLNVLQHFYNDDQVVKETWEKIDAHIGRLIEINELDHLFVMSDHGTNEIQIQFNVNRWLEKEGYLVRKTSSSDMLTRLHITRDTVRPILAKLNLEWIARKLVPRRIQYILPDSEGQVKMSGKERVIDWEKSKAVASGQGPVYVLAEDPEDRQSVRDELRVKLDGLTDDSGRPVLEAAHPAEDIYDGPYVTEGPDLLITQAPGTHINGNIGRDKVFEGQQRWQGTNKDEGMFVAYGPTIDPDAVLEEMHITDIAPTILHLQNSPIRECMDGTVREELFASNSDPGSREPSYIRESSSGRGSDSPDNKDVEAASERLKNLGYLE